MPTHAIEHCLPAAKFAPFAARVPIPVRPRLLALLDQAAERKLTIARGAVGAGKTTLLAHLHAHRQRSGQACAWISMDAADRTPAIFLRSFARAMLEAGVQVDARRVEEAVALADTSPEIAVRLFAAGARLSTRPVFVVLDDYDVVIGGFAGTLISSCLRHWECLRIVIAARAQLPSELGWLRQAGEVFELQQADLSLSLDEIRKLFRDLLPDEYAGLMLTRIGGAPIAANFAHEALSQPGRQTPRMPSRTWRDSLNDFYRERLFASLPAEARHFVTRLAIVEEFDVSLAHAISGSQAASKLENLYIDEGMLLRNPRTGWFYFPEPLREFLVDRLQWIEASERIELHAKACDWFTARGDYEQALVHAIAAGNSATVTELIEKIGGCGLTLRYGLSALKAAVGQVAVAEAHRPLITLSETMLLLQEGRLSEARQLFESLPKPDFLALNADEVASVSFSIAREYVLVSGLLSAYLDQPAESELLHALQNVLPTEDHASRGFVSNLLCGAAYQMADFAGADAACSRAVYEYAASNSAYGGFFMHLHRITIRYWQNDLAGALSESAAAETLLELFFPRDARLRALACVFRDFVRFDAGLAVDPASFLEQSLPEIAEREGWVDAQVIAHQLAARLAYDSQDAEAIQSVLRRGLRTADRMELPRLQWQVQALDLELKIASGEFSEAERLMADLAWCSSHPVDCNFLRWKERNHAHVLRARLALAKRDFESARNEIEALEAMSDRNIPRVGAKVKLLRALFSFSRGEIESARTQTLALTAMLGSLPSRQLFLEEGELACDMLRALLETALPASAERTLRTVLGQQPVTAQDLRSTRRKGLLTAREREVLDVMSEGRPNKIAAFEIGLSETTLKFHLRNIYKKLNARNRTEAVARYRSLAPEGQPLGRR